jgi:hypothetical protein
MVGVTPEEALAAQRRYASWLRWTTRVGVVLLVATFAIYITGIIPSFVPIPRLPSLWGLSAAQFLRQTHIAPGWHGWASLIVHGDMLVLGTLGVLICSSILCLVAALPIFWRHGERVLVAVSVLQIAVLAVAASGVLAR